VAYLERSTRVGRSQGASIFWGLVSVCFAAAACFYYWKNHENETTANVMRDQVLQLREENESLSAQKDHLEADQSEAESELKTREDLVQEKETELAAEETRLEGLGRQSQGQSQQNLAQTTVVKKFNDVIRKLGKESPPDVVERGGRPVLRVPNAELFAPGDATLKPDGKALLNQIALALNGQLDDFELRVVSYTDSDAEAESTNGQKNEPAADSKPHYATSWDLTSARASAIARFFLNETTLPSLNVLVIGRGDSEPISSNTGENHARNQRVEITVTPLPVPFYSPDPDKTGSGTAASADPPSPAPNSPASPNKEKAKEKKADKDNGSGF
jgi:outer membrane protein OmpA-like peptidoglycan-associated protein